MQNPEFNRERKAFLSLRRQHRSNERRGVEDQELFSKLVLADISLEARYPAWRRNYPDVELPPDLDLSTHQATVVTPQNI